MKVRMFISVKAQGTASLDPLLTDIRLTDGVRAAPKDQLHITLKFIGDIDDRKLPKVERCVRSAVEGVGPFDVCLKDVGCFPNRKKPSVFWVGASPADVLTGMADRISANLAAENIQFDEKPFKSHLTVGRCKGPADLDGLFAKYAGKEFCTFRCSKVLIMRSELGPAGAKHTVMSEVPLE